MSTEEWKPSEEAKLRGSQISVLRETRDPQILRQAVALIDQAERCFLDPVLAGNPALPEDIQEELWGRGKWGTRMALVARSDCLSHILKEASELEPEMQTRPAGIPPQCHWIGIDVNEIIREHAKRKLPLQKEDDID